MTWTTDEQGATSSEPVELYVFQSPSTTWRLTSYERDFVYASNTYTAVALARSSAITNQATEADDDVTVEIPATHALAQAYAAFVPPRELVVTILRYQSTSGVAIAIGGGYVTSLSFKGRFASFRIPGASDLFATQVPAIGLSSLCNHVLYDARCTVLRGSFQIAPVVATIATDRKSLTVSSISGKPDQWFRDGELLHSASSERRLVTSQVGTAINVQYRLPSSVAVGNALVLYAGCDHLVTTCRDKYGNIVNHGGMPYAPVHDPFYGSSSPRANGT